MAITISHPLAAIALTELRDKQTSSIRFRSRALELTRLLVLKATETLSTQPKTIQTPLQETQGVQFGPEHIVLAPILRAGLMMLDGAMSLLPEAEVRHVGLYRDEATLKPVEYYVKLPEQFPAGTRVMILDPMLATGGSATATIAAFKDRGVEHIQFLALIAAPEGIAAVEKLYPEVEIFAAAIDQGLDENSYIYPGLGDAGDRAYSTP
jgi:uracil phosphoribosyltransferase